MESKNLRDLGEFEKVDERQSIAKYQLIPIDTKRIDTDQALEGEPAREFKSGERPDLYAESHLVHRCKSQSMFLLMHVDASRAYFDAKAHKPVLVRLPAEDRSGKDEGKILTVEEEHIRQQRCSKQLGTRLTGLPRKVGLRNATQFEKPVSQQEEENLGFDTWR